eukprot:9284955-Lingulodinium_polyedra.AAC.1
MHISSGLLLNRCCSTVSRCVLTAPIATIGNHDANNSEQHHDFATRVNAGACCCILHGVLAH